MPRISYQTDESVWIDLTQLARIQLPKRARSVSEKISKTCYMYQWESQPQHTTPGMAATYSINNPTEDKNGGGFLWIHIIWLLVAPSESVVVIPTRLGFKKGNRNAIKPVLPNPVHCNSASPKLPPTPYHPHTTQGTLKQKERLISPAKTIELKISPHSVLFCRLLRWSLGDKSHINFLIPTSFTYTWRKLAFS